MNPNRKEFLQQLGLSAGTMVLHSKGVFPNNLENKSHSNKTEKNRILLFQGDSITEGGRSNNQDPNHIFGQDYMYLIMSRLTYEFPNKDYTFLNRGISGNTVKDLGLRWQRDALDIKPNLISILIGINDVDQIIHTPENESTKKDLVEGFEPNMTKILDITVQNLQDIKLVLMEPFILPVGTVQKNWDAWKNTLQIKQTILKRLAEKYNAIWIPLQDCFNKALLKAPPSHWIWDGIHPMPAGHQLIAENWIETVSKKIPSY